MSEQASVRICQCLWAAAMFAWFFLSALYLQTVLGYSPLLVGLAFLPSNLIMGTFSLGLSAKLVMRFGIKPPLALGLALAAVGLLLFARAPVNGNVAIDVLPSMLLLGIGAGMAFNPVLLAAMSGVKPTDSGLASGIVNTSFMMGGVLGLAILASLAAAGAVGLPAAGANPIAALNGGLNAAFLVGALCAAIAATMGYTLLRLPAIAPQKAVEPQAALARADTGSNGDRRDGRLVVMGGMCSMDRVTEAAHAVHS